MRIQKFFPELIEEATPAYIDKHFGLDGRAAQVAFGAVCRTFDVKSAVRALREADLFSRSVEPKLLLEALCTDQGNRMMMNLMHHYATSGHRIFSIEKDFFDKFRRVRLDKLRFSHLPLNDYGFVKLPTPIPDHSGDLFDEFFFYCGSKDITGIQWTRIEGYEETDNAVLVAYFVKDKISIGFISHAYPKDDSITIAEAFNLVTGSQNGATTISGGYAESTAVVMNLLAYIASGDPDIRHYRNTIRMRSPTSSHVVRADADLSRQDITLVGYNHLKERELKAGSWWSSAHMAWRWCGEGRKNVRLVFVKGSNKQWRDMDNVGVNDDDSAE